MLKLYTDRRYVPAGSYYVAALEPFWGRQPGRAGFIMEQQFDRLIACAPSFMALTPLEEADAALVPVDWKWIRDRRAMQRPMLELGERAAQQGEPVVVFFEHDSVVEVPIQNAVVFRASVYRSQRSANEFGMPGFFEDLVESYFGGQVPVRAKQEIPVVGFCGSPGLRQLSRVQRARQAARRVAFYAARMMGKRIAPPNAGRQPRRRALDALAQSPLVRTNFVFREGYFGGAIPRAERDERVIQVRNEFVQNMVESDYTVCVRGAGNWSIRLFETLCCGRIPVFVDTDCVLPFEELIDWRDTCVWVDEAEVPRIGEKVAEFHPRLSPGEFEERQRACRRLWEEWLSPLGFHAQIHRYITG